MLENANRAAVMSNCVIPPVLSSKMLVTCGGSMIPEVSCRTAANSFSVLESSGGGGTVVGSGFRPPPTLTDC